MRYRNGCWTGIDNRSRVFKSVVEVVELVCSHHIPLNSAAALFAACDGFHIIPDLPHVVLLQLLHVLELCLVPLFKCPLFLIEEIFDIASYPRFIVWEAMHHFFVGATMSIQKFR